MADETKTTQSAKSDPTDKAVKQAHGQALSPEDKHKNYLDELERLHRESVVDSLGHTPRAG